MKVISYDYNDYGERHETQLLSISGWRRVSGYSAARCTKSGGHTVWILDGVKPSTSVRAYHRNANGKVTIVEGMQAGPDGTDIY